MSVRRLVVLLAIAGSLFAAAPAQAIVGGAVSGDDPDPDTSYPWQTAVITTLDNDDWFCGGTRVAADLVLTAAHCVIDDDGQISLPQRVVVRSGNTVRTSQTFSRPTAVALYPGLDLQATPHGVPSGDVAMLRIPASAPGLPIPVIGVSETDLWDIGDTLRITGWGYTTTDPSNTAGYDLQPKLNWADVTRQSDDACASAYGADFIADTMLCARGPDPDGPGGRPGADTCYGDSGGPIAARMAPSGQLENPSVWRLVGVTSFGTGCGDPGFPGVYARLGAPMLHAFATDPDPVWAPVNQAPPTMPGSATAGDVVTCTPGAWTGEDLEVTYEFHRLGSPSTLLQAGPHNIYTVTAADDAGIVCVEIAANEGGTAWAQSSPTSVNLPAPPPTPVIPDGVPASQIPSGNTPRVPADDSSAGAVVGTTDRRSPRAANARARCASRRCTVSVQVTDPAPSSGIRRVTGTLRWKAACRRDGRRTTCARTRRIAGTKGSGTTWTLRTPRLPRGVATIAIAAVDRSGRIGTARLSLRIR